MDGVEGGSVVGVEGGSSVLGARTLKTWDSSRDPDRTVQKHGMWHI